MQAAQSVAQQGLGARSWVLDVRQPMVAFKTIILSRSLARGSWSQGLWCALGNCQQSAFWVMSQVPRLTRSQQLLCSG